jgi:hypothetical protein
MTSRRYLLHESTARALSRLGFLLFGLLPLCYCLYLSVCTFLPGYDRSLCSQWEAELGQAFGLEFEIESVQSPQPHQFRLRGIDIRLPESHALVGHIDAINLSKQSVAAGNQLSGEDILPGQLTWLVELRNPQLQLSQVAEATKIVHQWHMSRPNSSRQRAEFTANQLEFSDQHEKLTLVSVSGKILPDVNKWAFVTNFRLQPVNGSVSLLTAPQTESELVAVRDHSSESSSTGLQLRLNSPVPCSVLAKIFKLEAAPWSQEVLHPSLQTSQFQGVMNVRIKPSLVDYFLSDALIGQLDVGSLFPNSDALVQGKGDLRIAKANFNATGLKWAQGKIELTGGQIESSFLQSLAHHLAFRLTRPLQLGSVGFSRLGVEFEIQPQAFNLVGTSKNGMRNGVILEDALGPIAVRDDLTALPMISLVHALAFRQDMPSLPQRLTPLVRTAIRWLPLEERQRHEAELVIRR